MRRMMVKSFEREESFPHNFGNGAKSCALHRIVVFHPLVLVEP